MTQDTPSVSKAISRIPLVDPADLTPQQAKVYNHTASGKLNLYRLLAHATTMGPGFSQMIGAMMTDVSIPALERELVILATLHLDRGEYEWAQHLQVASNMGIPQAKVDAIAADRFGDASVFDARERALLAFVRQVVKSVRVDEYVFSALSEFYEPRQIVETIYVIGIYMLILRVSEVAELQVDAVLGGTVWKQARQGD